MEKFDALLTQLQTEDDNIVRDTIIAVTEIPGIFVFGEFLDHPSVQRLIGGPANEYVDQLELFCHGSFESYSHEPSKYPNLSANQLKKLKQLCIIDEAHERRLIPYSELFNKLGINSSRELEDLIIDLFYLEALTGKLDQKRALLEVDSAIGRDIRTEKVPELHKKFDIWLGKVETVLRHTATEIKLANERRLNSELHQKRVSEAVSMLKAALRIPVETDATRMDIDDHLGHPDLLPDSRTVTHRTASTTNVDSPGGDKDGQSRMGVFKGLRRGNR